MPDHQRMAGLAQVRNFNRRIEVVFPIYNEKIKSELETIIEMQWRDTVKARVIEKNNRNPYRRREKETPLHRAQTDIYEYLKKSS